MKMKLQCGKFPAVHQKNETARAGQARSRAHDGVVLVAQLHVMNVETEECLHWGPIGGSVINALHFGRDNRGARLLLRIASSASTELYASPGVVPGGGTDVAVSRNFCSTA